MIRTATLVLMLVLPSLAAADGSSRAAIKNDYSNICNAIERSGASKEKDVNARARLIAKYLRTAIKTPEVKAFFAKLASIAPEEKGPALRKAASDAGYTGECSIAD